MKLPYYIEKWLPYAAIALVYALGANLDIMEVDAAQYASISLEMLKSGHFLQVFDRFEDYLDKPPLLFWLSAVSFKIFGIGSWQYKLPSILFSLLGIFSTYKLGKRLYSEAIGRHASWILGGSFAMVMINNDIKTDTILVSSIVFSIWMLVSYLETKQLKYLLGSSLGIAAAMLTKGPIGLMMPALAVGGHIILKRQWHLLFDPKWFVLLIFVGILLVPMCIGLYEQYGTEGLKFYFWTQSFGRITGENEWRNDTTPLFFTHVFLWSFLPWTLLGVAGIFRELKFVKKACLDNGSELYLISGIVLVWAAFSFSKFKLPHYIFVVYPLIAILAAKFVHSLQHFSIWAWIQLILSSLSSIVLALILIYCFPAAGWWLPILLVLFVAAATLYFFNSYRTKQVIVPSFLISIAIGLGLNLHFYPQLLPFQANAVVGKWFIKQNIPEGKLIGFATGGRALDFYAHHIVPWMDTAEEAIEAIEPGTVVYATEERYEDLKRYGAIPKSEMVLPNFSVQKLSVKFLDPETRESAITNNYLLFY
ncbi:MAG: glycosyltransferase family 39 protein [Flavobacteriales bacterium]|nr:glycosyltransferase family 39 protein [Flavobacteriales bacterium]